MIACVPCSSPPAGCGGVGRWLVGDDRSDTIGPHLQRFTFLLLVGVLGIDLERDGRLRDADVVRDGARDHGWNAEHGEVCKRRPA